jgi:dynein intermediate chain
MADELRAQRQKALADKKKRLEELKARRSQRGTQTVTAAETARSRVEASANLDDYIDGLLQAPSSASQPTQPSAGDAPQPSATGEAPQNTGNETAGASGEDSGNVAAPSPAPAPVPAAAPEVKAEQFEMGTQTSDEDFPPPSDYDEEEQQHAEQAVGDQSNTDNKVSGEAAPGKEQAKIQEDAKVLTAEEVEKELASETFSSFLNTASKKVERVLGSAVLADLLMDYDGETDGTERAASKASDGSKFISSRQVYECPQWTATRDVTDMDWSPLHRELMLCSYHMPNSTTKLGEPKGSTAVKVISPEDTPSDSLTPRSLELQSDGLALVWNLAMSNRPEHVFTCGSPVTSTRFHPTESPLIIGGCQSGQVVVWDVRAGRMPVQKSSLTTTSSGNSKGHTHPICAMATIEGGVSTVECRM